jgi:hypothetical protein
MRALYNFDSKAGESKGRFLQNQWAKYYKKRFTSYREYQAAMESKAVLDQETQTYKFI